MNRRYALIAAGCAALAMAGCDGGKVIKTEKAPPTLDSISLEWLYALSKKRIFFGHQSVGWNIIDGLKDVAREKGWPGFDFIETRTPDEAPGFYHAGIGQNGDPLGKIADFEAIMRAGMGGKVDIAFMKFCYVDFHAGTDVDSVFASYRDAMKRLDAEYPGTVFVRVTVPLEAVERGAKARIKRMLGFGMPSIEGNIARERMNASIRAECLAAGSPLYDLASIESTEPSGERIEREYRGKPYYSLAAESTSDGGHLNESGRLMAAIGLSRALAESLRGSGAPGP